MAPSIAQRALFDGLDHERAAKVMAAMDGVDRGWGHAMVMPAAVCIAAKSAVTAKLEMRSPRFTTRWEELPNAYWVPSPSLRPLPYRSSCHFIRIAARASG
ncbi:DUF4113 domain-containing protein [Mesorhizobium sp. B2-4-9]|nr:DUF4113 domain-containing protein [Mesorhizobium sp. B2-4-9]